MAHSIYTVRVQGADGRITPASFRASSLAAAEAMALARGYDVIVSGDDDADAGVEAPETAVSVNAAETSPGELDGEVAGPAARDGVEGASVEAEAGTGDADPEDDADAVTAPSPAWAPLAWIAPLVLLAIGAGLTLVLPAAPAPRIVVTVAILLLLVVAGVISVAAIVSGRRGGQRSAVVHGGAGLALSGLLLVGIGAGTLPPLLASLRAAPLPTRAASEAPYRSGAGTVTASTRSGNALVRTVLIDSAAPSGESAAFAAQHRAAVLVELPAQHGVLVQQLRDEGLRLVDRLVAGAPEALVAEVEFAPADWPRSRQR